MAILTLLFGRDVLGTYEMDRDVMVLGRATDCDVVIDNLNVTRHHTKIEKREGLYYPARSTWRWGRRLMLRRVSRALRSLIPWRSALRPINSSRATLSVTTWAYIH